MELKTTIDPDLINRFIFFRKRYVHKSQTKAAKILRIAQSNLSKLESGQKEIRLDLIKVLTQNFELNHQWLLTGKGTPKKNEPVKPEEKDLTSMIADMAGLEKLMKMMEINQRHMLTMLQEMEKKNQELEKQIELLKKEKK
jgi:transcriptional regulator with XRE-family HTH domain